MKNNYIKSPLNYVGGKYKLLPQIEPLFPYADKFVDLFCGGFNVGINARANSVVGNDLQKEVIEVFKGIRENGAVESLRLIKEQIAKYDLSKTNERGFKSIRNDYNQGNRQWYVFYAMLTHAFNYQIRFNNKGEYNMPFGRNRSSFNPNLEKNFIRFSKEINERNVAFTTNDFRCLAINKLTSNDFVYLDPPYLLGCANYNEQGGWTVSLEKDMYTLCDTLNSKNIKFAISNVIKHKGETNAYLENWGGNYNIHYLNYNYNNCNYHSNNKNNETIEVLITNYKLNDNNDKTKTNKKQRTLF